MLFLIKNHFQILIFAIITVIFTGLGQTFFIAQFLPNLQLASGLDRVEISFVYSLATFFASFNLTFFGKLIDRTSLVKFSVLTVFGIVLGMNLTAIVTGPILAFLGLYCLRSFGQITLGLIVTSFLSRKFGAHRGKALAFASFGKAIGEGILPIVIVSLIANYSWEKALSITSIVFLFLSVPLFVYIFNKYDQRPIYEENLETVSHKTSLDFEVFSWKQSLNLKYPLITMLVNALMPFIMTGIIFQQDKIIEYKEWSQIIMAKAFIGFSLLSLITTLVVGHLIDKYRALNIQPFILLPLLFALLIFQYFNGEWVCYAFMAVAAISVSMSSLIRGSFYAEVYGLKALGQIKGMDSSLTVIGTSVAPLIYSLLLDNGMEIKALFNILIFLTIVGLVTYAILNKFYKNLLKRS